MNNVLLMLKKPLNDAMLAAPELHFLELFATIGTEDVVLGCQEPSADQGYVAAFAVEAVIVPLALLKGNVLAAAKT